MPRIYNSDGEPLDYCKGCFPDEVEAEEQFFNAAKEAENEKTGNGGYGYECEHPPYDGEGYTCEECKKVLTEKDD